MWLLSCNIFLRFIYVVSCSHALFFNCVSFHCINKLPGMDIGVVFSLLQLGLKLPQHCYIKPFWTGFCYVHTEKSTCWVTGFTRDHLSRCSRRVFQGGCTDLHLHQGSVKVQVALYHYWHLILISYWSSITCWRPSFLTESQQGLCHTCSGLPLLSHRLPFCHFQSVFMVSASQ